MEKWGREELTEEEFFRRLDLYTDKLSERFSDIPLLDLRLILFNLLKPKSWPKRWLLRRIGKDRYVP